MMSFKLPVTIYLFLFGLLLILSCKKIVEINPPINSITTSEVFADSSDAQNAVIGIYSSMMFGGDGSFSFGCGSETIICGMSADELQPFYSNTDLTQIYTNHLLASNAYTSGYIWTEAFSYLYQANAIIEGLGASTTLSNKLKNEYSSEARFFRALIDFYLVNLYGNIPLIQNIDYKANALAKQISPSSIYSSIISDLRYADSLLPMDYSVGGGERIRVNKWGAEAMLARVYLYRQQWDSAEVYSTNIINYTGLFSLCSLDSVFLANSQESILQWQNNATQNYNSYNATGESLAFIPFDSTTNPNYYLTSQLLMAFETGDLRRTVWVDSTDYNGTYYYYPYKYQVGPSQLSSTASVSEYYTVLRLAEQYLIRAEARAQLGNTAGAVADLNVIRLRAGLTAYGGPTTQAPLLSAIFHERQIELFAEWGHRWLDLKRTMQADVILGGIAYKQAWGGDNQLIYPIPPNELKTDPNLVQNVGY
jgi:starch-binding outer membrane protein, SusD/RagB family